MELASFRVSPGKGPALSHEGMIRFSLKLLMRAHGKSCDSCLLWLRVGGCSMNNTLLLAVGPVVAAAITVGGIWLKEALQRRGRDEERRRRMDQAKAQIEIVDAWARARASLNTSTDLAEGVRTRAQEALDVAYDGA